MKRNYLIAIALCIFSVSLVAQVSQTFNYQAVARDQNGNLLGDQSLTVRIGIIQDGNLVWQEDHPVSTNSIGHFDLKIGNPDALNPLGSVGSFSEIPWGAGEYQLQVSLDAGNGFIDLGTSELQAVPFALYAADGPGGMGPQGIQGEPGPPGPAGADEQELNLDGNLLSITGGNSVDLTTAVGSGSQWSQDKDTISTFNYVGIGTSNPNLSTLAVQGLNVGSESPLFEVRREDGFPVFAVYNDGVMVYVDEEAKGVKGGFAVGGYRRSAKGITQEYLTVSPDSVRIYVPNENGAKGVKGGFAVGGFRRSAKGPSQDLLFINSDSTRVYVPNKGNDPGFEGLQGGFAV
ncbi:MAG: hypothetical protein KAT15_26075, partial [Bacteroidales bacterium]|nr:hypothetical protein [Bacteroidales bacterium]